MRCFPASCSCFELWHASSPASHDAVPAGCRASQGAEHVAGQSCSAGTSACCTPSAQLMSDHTCIVPDHPLMHFLQICPSGLAGCRCTRAGCTHSCIARACVLLAYAACARCASLRTPGSSCASQASQARGKQPHNWLQQQRWQQQQVVQQWLVRLLLPVQQHWCCRRSQCSSWRCRQQRSARWQH